MADLTDDSEPTDDELILDDLPTLPDDELEGDELLEGEESLGGEEPLDGEVSDDETHVDYDVADWSGQSRSLLDSLLGSGEIPHTWQGTTLTVLADDEAAVEAIIDEVNATATQGLDPDEARVVYEVGTWSAAMQMSLAEALGVAQIDFEWDENGDLVIYEDDEESVEEILDGMPDPDDPDVADVEGVDVQAVLTELWEATGSLASNPKDADGVLKAIHGADAIEQIALPFGFEPAVWRDIVGKTLALRAALDSPDEDDQLSDDDLVEGCAQLHAQLRTFI